MTDYEKGSPAWDIGMVLTRHDHEACSRTAELRRTVHAAMSAEDRLARALDTHCTCGAGDSLAETTSQRGTAWDERETNSPV